MGRHGGGSRSGGSHRSSSGRSGGSSRGGGSGIRTSTVPFRGCYNRTYYDRRGRLHRHYTNNREFGTKSGLGLANIMILLFITVHMCFMIGGMLSVAVVRGEKINGNRSRIMVMDHAEILTEREETEILSLLEQVYEKSGMPVTVYTDDFSWKKHYNALEIYSEELYYAIGMDESAMIILFTANDDSDFYDWEYDVYCGDDTEKCFSDAAFDKFLENFQKGMSRQKLADALQYAWDAVMDDLAKTRVNMAMLPTMIVPLIVYGIFYAAILGPAKKQNDAYRYFKENPEKLSLAPMVMYSVCPNCGASNASQGEVCSYCGTVLKVCENKKYY